MKRTSKHKKTKRNKLVRRIFSQRLRGFNASEDDVQLIVDIINVLADKELSVSYVLGVLEDVKKIIPLISGF